MYNFESFLKLHFSCSICTITFELRRRYFFSNPQTHTRTNVCLTLEIGSIANISECQCMERGEHIHAKVRDVHTYRRKYVLLITSFFFVVILASKATQKITAGAIALGMHFPALSSFDSFQVESAEESQPGEAVRLGRESDCGREM
jgi:hypothetical protein